MPEKQTFEKLLKAHFFKTDQRTANESWIIFYHVYLNVSVEYE